ncbi:unnamed protein product [Phytophthora fragariaefolia]|uniref:Unnamed protein product n=1 Tax=Phytophthora fragariaefolia TaxID=1490495 RepID=A0A9W6UE04_9STRA|nr:unnamed protein product [Phytophthora fragariaefolia]
MESGDLSRKMGSLRGDIEQLDSTNGELVAQVPALESKRGQLDVKLAEATPRVYYERVLLKLKCTGDEELLLEALSNASGRLDGSVEHAMGEASTGRFLTLQERAQQEVPQIDTAVVSDPTSGGQNILEVWLKLERKYGSHQAVVDHVQEIESGITQKEADLEVVAPGKMLHRIKQALTWVGDIELLREALDKVVAISSKSGSTSNERQLVLLEARSTPSATVLGGTEDFNPKREIEPSPSQNGDLFSVFKSEVKASLAAKRNEILRVPPNQTKAAHRASYLLRAAKYSMSVKVTPDLCNTQAAHTLSFHAAALDENDMHVGS